MATTARVAQQRQRQRQHARGLGKHVIKKRHLASGILLAAPTTAVPCLVCVRARAGNDTPPPTCVSVETCIGYVLTCDSINNCGAVRHVCTDIYYRGTVHQKLEKHPHSHSFFECCDQEHHAEQNCFSARLAASSVCMNLIYKTSRRSPVYLIYR